jgi:hypothetical protein
MCLRSANQRRGTIIAKRKKQSSKVQKGKEAAPSKARKVSKAARKATKRIAAKAKHKRAAAKKAAPPVATATETVAVEVIEQPASA